MISTLSPDMFDPACPSNAMPIKIGDKWSAAIIRCLEDGPRRFSEFQIPLRGITTKVLTGSLRSLERDGLIERTVYPEVPLRVEYTLTPLGRTLLEPLDAAAAWARQHMPALLAAREEYDRRTV
ncbi:transcriptional regulator [Streptomyces griseocarneus]|nr:transcriptional regulator [Streptomyces griseocarneus]